jgi:hypothetical protein
MQFLDGCVCTYLFIFFTPKIIEKYFTFIFFLEKKMILCLS